MCGYRGFLVIKANPAAHSLLVLFVFFFYFKATFSFPLTPAKMKNIIAMGNFLKTEF